MIHSRSKRTPSVFLFGGALFGAGICGHAEASPQFQWDATSQVFAYAAYGQVSTDTFAGSGDGSVFAYRETGGYAGSVIDTRAYASWDANGHRAETLASSYRFATLDQTGPGYGTTDVHITHEFAVSEDAWLDVEWDLLDATDAIVSVVDLNTQTALFTHTEGSSGADSFVLNAGTQYSLVYMQIANGFAGAQSNAHSLSLRVIPSPGVAPLFIAVCGYAGLRRRR